jgi:hypothetical protein
MVDNYIEPNTNKVLGRKAILFKSLNTSVGNDFGHGILPQVVKSTAERYQLNSVLSDEVIKKFDPEILEQLALSHLGDLPQLDVPTFEQKQWVLHKLKGSASTWRRCC